MPSTTITATGSRGHHIFDLYVNETATSTSNNTSTVAFTFSMRPSGYDWYYSPPSKPVNYTVLINGVNYSGTIYEYAANTSLTIQTGTQTVSHNSNGTKTIDISFSVASIDAYYLPGSAAANGTLTLTSIARYPSVTQSLSSATEATLTVKWSSDSVIDIIKYSTNNGTTWTTVDVADGKSGTYTITGLAGGASYNVKTRVRSKASQLETTSSASAFKTIKYPYASSTPNFTIGQSVKIGLANPLGRSVTVQLRVLGSGVVVGSASTSGTSVTITPSASILYNAIKNSRTGTYYAVTWYAGYSYGGTQGTFSANANVALPSISTLTYHDTDPDTTFITRDDQLIVQNRSLVRFDATGLAGYQGSTISSASITVNGVSQTMTVSGTTATVTPFPIDSAADVAAILTVTDSRGMQVTKSVTLTMLEYAAPTATVTAVRKNNFYAETDIKARANVSSLDGSNFFTLKYRTKKLDGSSSYGPWNALSDNVTVTATLDNEYAWEVQVEIADILTTTYVSVTVLEGTPILYIDRIKRSVSLNGFPTDEGSLEVDGHDLRRHAITASLSTWDTSLISGSYTKIALDASVVAGSKLTLYYGSVKIGGTVAHVMVSARVLLSASSTSGVRAARIYKNSIADANLVAWTEQGVSNAGYIHLVIPPTLAEIAAGDELILCYYAQSGDTLAGASAGNVTALTVNFVD